MKQNLLLLALIVSISTSCGQTQSTGLIKELNNLSYIDQSNVENEELQRLNLVLPQSAKDRPLLIWIGGGAWSYVDRHMEMDLGRKFAEEGIAFASVGHRLSPATWKDPSLNKGVKHPEHVKDVALAVKWLYENASKYGYSPNKLFIGGYSSGAHLSALLSLDSTYLNEVGLSPQKLKGIIPIAGAYDMLNYYNVFLNSETNSALAETHVKAVFGETEQDLINASPTKYVHDLSVPMLLISENTTYNYTRIFEEAIVAADYQNFEVVHISEMGHADLWKHLSYDENSTYRNDIVRFIKENSL